MQRLQTCESDAGSPLRPRFRDDDIDFLSLYPRIGGSTEGGSTDSQILHDGDAEFLVGVSHVGRVNHAVEESRPVAVVFSVNADALQFECQLLILKWKILN